MAPPTGTDRTASPIRALLLRQFDIAWKLTEYQLGGQTTEECLWRPAPVGLHVHRECDGPWRADWPEREDYGIGPASIAWVTWHIDFWWSMVLDHSFGAGSLVRETVTWPGDADGVRARLTELQGRWRGCLAVLGDADLQSSDRTRWPMRDRPFGEVVAWVNLELMKNAAEIGYARFLHAARTTDP